MAFLGATIWACGGSPLAPSAPPTDPPVVPPPAPATTVNGPPQIVSLSPTSTRAEAGDAIVIRATVKDQETPVDQLIFEWTASGGTFEGAGPEVRWRAPADQATPATYTLRLTVIERYSETGADGFAEPKEHRVSSEIAIDVNASVREITLMAETFLRDFADSTTSAAFCVRNFSDSCRGKGEEQSDIEFNRANYVILASRYSIASVTLDPPRLSADIVAPCEFTSRTLATGVVSTVTGTCLMTAIYEARRWWLCDSRFRGNAPLGFWGF